MRKKCQIFVFFANFLFAMTLGAAHAAPITGIQDEYLVFFDWDKSTITPAADRVISDFVAAAGGQSIYVTVIGHTDTSEGGPDTTLQDAHALSLLRAESVERTLIAKGLLADHIQVIGMGFDDLLVMTGDNVREPSNRRAQILPSFSPFPVQVPEPGSLALLGSGLLGLAFLRRRKQT